MRLSRFKFSVRTLLICTTLVAIYLCAAQIQRRHIMKIGKEFEAEGVTLIMKNDWIDYLWMRQPTHAMISSKVVPQSFIGGNVAIVQSLQTSSPSPEKFQELLNRLEAMGLMISFEK